MEGNTKNEGTVRDEIFSKAIRAGKRTYFFDVKTTRRNDYYLTITERKKRFEDDGRYAVEKHKLFLYKEDFEKFKEGLFEAVEYIESLQDEDGNYPETNTYHHNEDEEDARMVDGNYVDLEFEDLVN